jgi:hypothetical protein
MHNGGVEYYYGFDMSGNTRLLVNSAGSITDAWGYQTFGD